ncbi:hypothetical protein ONS95_009103 [Cadophora gregata]|uniref:uncharacterized protein n=1 Tax=Cadophora gregata TaxID=51156 RepID=UPI0026DB6DF1|nr:uncharacterized protein ONS95_009103 [Cadophora gregata]KAK0124120.1 hypothetical protein ONS95_009103 [Cadophora gregata]
MAGVGGYRIKGEGVSHVHFGPDELEKGRRRLRLVMGAEYTLSVCIRITGDCSDPRGELRATNACRSNYTQSDDSLKTQISVPRSSRCWYWCLAWNRGVVPIRVLYRQSGPENRSLGIQSTDRVQDNLSFVMNEFSPRVRKNDGILRGDEVK